jgi:hypothetical protein
MEKYLYFRAVADQDADDGVADSVYIPASSITALVPTSTTVLTVFFESFNNEAGNGTDDENVISDSIPLTCTQGKVKKVMRTIVNAINSNHLYQDGVITIADDVTTTYLTSSASADQTVAGKYIDPNITACGAIVAAGALS